jgi:hypothetical protein
MHIRFQKEVMPDLVTRSWRQVGDESANAAVQRLKGGAGGQRDPLQLLQLRFQSESENSPATSRSWREVGDDFAPGCRCVGGYCRWWLEEVGYMMLHGGLLVVVGGWWWLEEVAYMMLHGRSGPEHFSCPYKPCRSGIYPLLVGLPAA